MDDLNEYPKKLVRLFVYKIELILSISSVVNCIYTISYINFKFPHLILVYLLILSSWLIEISRLYIHTVILVNFSWT